MIQNKNQVEQLILHAIANWQEHMTSLSYRDEANQKYPFCPKRFIYECACRFERKNIQKALNTMVKIGYLTQHPYPKHPSNIGYEITKAV